MELPMLDRFKRGGVVVAAVVLAAGAMGVPSGVWPVEAAHGRVLQATASQAWQLDLQISPLRIAQVEVAKGDVRAFYYLTYTVTNNTSRDLRLFAPSWELMTGDGTITRSGRDVPGSVVAQLKAKVSSGDQVGDVVDQIEIIGPLMQGKENARRGLVVFAASSLRPTDLSVFAAGFSSETQEYIPPAPVAREGGKETRDPVILRKSRMIRYFAPGDLTGRGDEPLSQVEATWVMR
jgi:hypothetical protein